MIRFILMLVAVWLALLPPFFTDGACTAEFDHVATLIADNDKALASPESAFAYWRSRNVPVQVISIDQCHRSRPRFVEDCGLGDLVYAAVPIQNKICRFYRDSKVRVQLQYDERGRLRQVRTDMNPFKYLPLPWLGVTLNWAK
jgi:hypothetical protein